MFCHELTDCWTDCRRSNTVNWIMKFIWMRITCYLKISSSLSKYCTLYSILFRMKSLLIADFYTSESHTWLKEEVKKLQSIQQAKSGVDIVSAIRVKTHYARPIGADQTIGRETLIGPAMPSTTARAGGVFLPIIKSLTFSWK
ncbi:hypothetical protein R3W88_029515 [Solanum pinnatisectum]|uniref:Uncharacterized protein n=1 Tax=Solanum pinnatisectum TaxID=50273 RepID=A0AAV9K7R6_9SOLN|nr:hypothetical protein R3W88_029515 [Solanum pinnatisectum]